MPSGQQTEEKAFREAQVSYNPGEEPGKISVRIVSFSEGLISLDGVRLVRVASEDHTLLIMEDFAPVIGEVHNGTVTVLHNGEERRYEVKRGYYLHSHNSFSLVISQEGKSE